MYYNISMEKKVGNNINNIHHCYNPMQHTQAKASCKGRHKHQKQSWVIDKKYNALPSARNCIKYIFVFSIMIVSIFALLFGGLLAFFICTPLVSIFILWLGASILEKLLKMLNL